MRAIPYVLEKYPLVHFTFIGRDTFINSRYSSFKGRGEESVKDSLLKNFPQAYKDDLTFLGHVEQEVLSQHLMSCDLFVAPSLYETFGLVYVEAMSYAKPVIGCAVGGVPEVIKDGETGILVPSEDHSSLGQAIIQLLKDPQMRIKMGKNAKADVENNFTIEHMVEKTLAAYKKALKIP
jgi:glycosyltransferase involved in cell wall biosynthesis